MITAAPVILRPMESIGAPGLTDFTSIFIASELNKEEYRTTLRHEQAHVWAAHNRRFPKECVVHLWNIACEMEIARNIYDAQDIATIIAPRSRLHGAFLPDSVKGLPDDLLLAEEIYEWLLKNPSEEKMSSCSTHCCEVPKENETGDRPVSMQDIRKQLDQKEKEEASSEAVHSIYANLCNRPLLLTDAIDAALRYRVVRESSYRRPSRRESPNVIRKGEISTPRPPRIEIFVDRSGSFNAAKTMEAERCVAVILGKYRASVSHDTWYFGNDILSAIDIPGGGNTPYGLIAAHLCKSQPKLAIVITDDDPAPAMEIPTAEILCIPVGCSTTNLHKAVGGRDVVTR